MVKYIKNCITPLILVMLGLTGCQKELENAYGQLQVQMSTDVSIETKNQANTNVAGLVYAVKIRNNADQSIVYETSDHTTMPATFRLVEGQYTITAVSGNADQVGLITAPAYTATKQVVVVAGVTEQIELIAQLAQVKVKMSVSPIIDEHFTDIVLSLKHEQGATPFAILTKDKIGNEYYIAHTGTLYWTLDMINTQGEQHSVDGIIENVAARDFLNFDFKMTEVPANQGVALLNVQLTKNVDVIMRTILVMTYAGDIPEFIPVGNFTDGSSIDVNMFTRDVEAAYAIKVPNKIKSLTFYHYSDVMESYGIPKYISLTELTQTVVDEISAAGLPTVGAVNGSPEAKIHLTELCKILPEGTYPISMIVIDQNDQVLKKSVIINIMPDDLSIIDVDIWGEHLIITGQYVVAENPGGLTFEYRKKNDINWIRVPEKDVMVSGKEFTATIRQLVGETEYEIRPTSNVGPAIVIKAYKTDIAPTSENLNFDGGYWNGSTFYPNASGGNSYWATGNEGLTYWLSGKPSNTYHTDDAVQGKAMELKSVGGITIVGHAAGNLYTGSFLLDIGNPKNSVKFGRPFNGRPTALKGWFKYKSSPITLYKEMPEMANKPDLCHIYVKLEDWGNPDLGPGQRPSTAKSIAYGEMFTSENVTEYTEFNFPIVYENATKDRPTHIIMVVTSSKYGENFCGGISSVLHVDEFKFVY